MFTSRYCLRNISALALGFALMWGVQSAFAEDEEIIILDTVQVVGTAEEQAKQALGTSIITSKDIEKHPPVNDLSDIIRRQPGVNLTGNTATGIRGNNRQIDLRGMGPENTLILIDGRPVTSRNSVRYGWNGERDTRGDSNWVPAEMVERVEILRGPAAARYGSGAMGGVVNIITKKAADKLSGSMSVYANIPEDSKEGGNRRVNFSFSGPVSESVSFRVYGSKSKTDADEPELNDGVSAGREGVINEDINALLSWAVNREHTLEAGTSYSKQSNLYAGDRTTGSGVLDNPLNGGSDLIGTTTNKMYRRNFFLTHLGNYNWGTSRLDLNYDQTDNIRLPEGLAGGTEGNITTDEDWYHTELENLRAKGEVNIPFTIFGIHQTLTLGTEFLNEKMKDPDNFNGIEVVDANGNPITLPGQDEASDVEQYSYAFYIEDNIYVGRGVTITPGVRFDYHEIFGSNVSPSLNAEWEINENWMVKGGIARAYKAPNIYQSNPNYLMQSTGNGCTYVNESGGCLIQGNDELEPEISINKEIGIAFNSDLFRASATYFHNDYQNKILSGIHPVSDAVYYALRGTAVQRRSLYLWQNATDAVIEGVEGSIFIPVGKNIDFNTNVTFMIKSETEEDKQPLSVTPDYTVNMFVDWRVTDSLLLGANATFYGKQEPRNKNRRNVDPELAGDALKDRDPYHLFSIYGTYKLIDSITFKAGVNNLFDKQLRRDGVSSDTAGANTYNEPGRSYYVAATLDF